MCLYSPVCLLSVKNMLTAQILQDKVQLSTCLEGIDKVHNKRMLNLLQNVPLSFSVRCVLCITYNHGLAMDRKSTEGWGWNDSGSNLKSISLCQTFNISCRGRALNRTPGLQLQIILIKPINIVINQNLKLRGIWADYLGKVVHQLCVSCREKAKLNRSSRAEVSWGKACCNYFGWSAPSLWLHDWMHQYVTRKSTLWLSVYVKHYTHLDCVAFGSQLSIYGANST